MRLALRSVTHTQQHSTRSQALSLRSQTAADLDFGGGCTPVWFQSSAPAFIQNHAVILSDMMPDQVGCCVDVGRHLCENVCVLGVVGVVARAGVGGTGTEECEWAGGSLPLASACSAPQPALRGQHLVVDAPPTHRNIAHTHTRTRTHARTHTVPCRAPSLGLSPAVEASGCTLASLSRTWGP